MTLSTKCIIENLPITEEFRNKKRLIQERGELALIEDGMNFKHLGYFSLLAGKGYRGGHYHIQKTEHFYVIKGCLLVEVYDMETGEKDKIEMNTGIKATIYPLLAHRFQALEDAQVIEYYNGVFQIEDDIHCQFFD